MTHNRLLGNTRLQPLANTSIINIEIQYSCLGTRMAGGKTLAQALGREERIWLTRKEAAAFLTRIGCPISVWTLAQMAVNNNAGKGPAFTRTGWKTLRYEPADLRAWAEKKITRVE